MSTDLTQPGHERPATRIELAHLLLLRVERLSDLLGTVPIATEIQLLKRDLSRGHDFLRTSRERNFLSLVTLIEAALACLTWKEYTPEIVAALRQALSVGTRREPFTFADYDAIRRQFAESGIRTMPSIDLNALEPGDLDDGQES